MTEIQQVIQNALVRYDHIRRMRYWLTAIATVALIFVLAALLDRVCIFSGWERWSGWITGLIIAALAARRVAGAICPDACSLAHRVEGAAGETIPVVATAIDPAVRRTADHEALSKVLLERLDDRAAEAIRLAPPTFRGRMRTPICLIAAAAVALALLVAVQGGQGLIRVLVPWYESPYTSLTLEGPTEPFAEGQAFTLTAKVSGMAVEKVILYQQGSPEPLAEGTPDEQGVVRLTVDGLDAPTDFLVRGGDGRSDPLRVEPYYLPSIEAFDIAVIPPEYASHTADVETAPSFSAFRGSQLRYRLHLKAPAVSVTIERSAAPREEEWATPEEQADMRYSMYGVRVGDEEPVDEEVGAIVFTPDPSDPLVWESDWDLSNSEDIVYRLAIEGDHGDRIRNDEPWRINVISDGPPNVRIHSHNGSDVIRNGDETVQFDLSAVDDVRLAEVRLIFRKPGRTHTRQVVSLPPDALRTWSGAELLDLAPLDLRPLEIVAVHAEAEDANALDGPGLGRSEIVYLEVPLPESSDDGGGGGGGGGGTPPINPLELQMEILASTVRLPNEAPASERAALAFDQRQNAMYVSQMEMAAASDPMAMPLAMALNRAYTSMEMAAQLLDTSPSGYAIPAEEAALGALIDAAKLLQDMGGEMPPGGGASDQLTFTLQPPNPSGASSGGDEEDAEDNRQALLDLMEEVRRQMEEQQALNQGSGDRAQQQQSLAQDARSAASQARGVPSSASGRGDPRAAAEELDRAAGLQDDTADAMSGGDEDTSGQLGEQSAEALEEALRMLAAQLGAETYGTEVRPLGYERLVDDYLRSISYE